MMEYKGYVASVEFDSDADLFHGRVVNTRDVITFQGASVAELHEEFSNSVDDYLEFCAERGEEPDRPFSGKIALRIDPALHRAVALNAAKDSLSINAWITARLKENTSRSLVFQKRPRPSIGIDAPSEFALTARSSDIAGIDSVQEMWKIWHQVTKVTARNPSYSAQPFVSGDTLIYLSEEPTHAS